MNKKIKIGIIVSIIIIMLVISSLSFFHHRNVTNLKESGFEQLGGFYMKDPTFDPTDDDKYMEAVTVRLLPKRFTMDINTDPKESVDDKLAGIWIGNESIFGPMEYAVKMNSGDLCFTDSTFKNLKEDADVQCFEDEDLLKDVDILLDDIKANYRPIPIPYFKEINKFFM